MIVILGAGPAGLATAGLLHQRGLDPLVLERDPGPGARTQGGSLDLGERSGQRTLDALGLRQRFTALARPQGQRFRVLDPAGTVLAEVGPDGFDEARPEIDRDALRTLLLGAVPGSAIRWNAHVVALRRTGDAWQVDLADGTTITADTVLACDGLRSPARRHVSPDAPAYTGITFVGGHIQHPDPTGTAARLVGDGAMFAIGAERAIMGQRGGDGSIRMYYAFRAPADRCPALADVFGDYHPDLLAIADAIDEYRTWPLHGVPADQHWHHRPGLTLLGDAAHVMPPFSGQGVNMALLDALDLATAVDAAGQGDCAVRDYESRMLTRMREAIHATTAAQDRIITPDGPAVLLRDLA